MDKMREEFEAWWISKNPNNADVGLYWHETGYWVNSNSAYSNLDFAWECWKASRAAICVDLNSFVFSRDKNGEGGLMLPERVFKAMDEAGVSYK